MSCCRDLPSTVDCGMAASRLPSAASGRSGYGPKSDAHELDVVQRCRQPILLFAARGYFEAHR